MRKLSLLLTSLAILTTATACNESVHWLECDENHVDTEYCVGGQIYLCSYNQNNNTMSDGYYLDQTDGTCDDSTPDIIEVACQQNQTMCKDNTPYTCSQGKWKSGTACSNDQVCVTGTCMSCLPGTTKCDDNGDLVTCNPSGIWDAPNTCPPNTMCGIDPTSNQAACIDAPATCTLDDGSTIEQDQKICLNDDTNAKHAVMRCHNGELKEDTVCDEAKHEVCSTLDDEFGCFATIDSVIGAPCSCQDESAFPCRWSYTSDELKSLFHSSNSHLVDIKTAINEGVELLIPNFFPGVDAIVTENDAAKTLQSQIADLNDGLAVGCYRSASIPLSSISTADKIRDAINNTVDNYKVAIAKTLQKTDSLPNGFANETGIDFSLSYADLTDEQKNELNAFVDTYFKDQIGFELAPMITMITSLVDVLLKDIRFTSENGYLTAGAFLAEVELNGPIGSRLFDDRSSNSQKLTDQLTKLNAGDPQKAMTSAQCPEGSTFLAYRINQEVLPIIDTIGDAAMTMAMCFKNCNSDYDCPAGNQCLNLPKSNYDFENDAVLKDAQLEMVRVCFDKATVDNLQTMLDDANIAPTSI